MSAVSLDRFAYGLPDPQDKEPAIVAACANCGRYLRVGDEVLREEATGDLFCDSRCYVEFARKNDALTETVLAEEDLPLWQ